MLLSVIDQSPVTTGQEASWALQNTLNLAALTDKLGYHRYWVSEHHDSPAFANAAPEVLIAALAARTKRIRIGSGGVLLSHYSPFKVAEQFNLLEALHPGRIDLGIGRAGGGARDSDKALSLDSQNRLSCWEKLDQLQALLGQGSAKSVRPWRAVARPSVTTKPEVWVLGTSPASAKYAGQNGMPYSFGAFIDPRQAEASLLAYQQSFRPSAMLKSQKSQLALFVLASNSEAESKRLARSAELWMLRTFVRGRSSTFPTAQEILKETISSQEAAFLAQRRALSLLGTAEQVVEQLHGLQKRLALHEISLVTITAEPEARTESYRAIARAAGLTSHSLET